MSAEQQHKRVMVTGFGCLTAAANHYQQSWVALNQGMTGVARITQWDIDGWEFPLGGEIKDYNPKAMVTDRKLLKVISRQDIIGLNSVSQALDHSGMLTFRDTLSEADTKAFNDRTGIFVGSPGNRFQQQYDFLPLFSHANGNMKKFAAGLFEHIHPMWLLRILPNNVLAYVGIQYGFKGANENVANHAVSGTQAIAEAYRRIGQGIIDRAVVVGYESGIEPEGQIYYGSLGTLSPTEIKSFDKDRSGTILGEGAGCLILESYHAAKARNATIYGEILGDATTTEAMGVFPVRSDAKGLIRTIEYALQHAQVASDDVGMITAHANATQISDATEAIAINAIFGANSVPVTGFKWCFGHTLTAAGTIETIMTLLALREKNVPGIASLENKASDCEKLNVSHHAQPTRSDIALVITRGFASVNSCLIVSSH